MQNTTNRACTPRTFLARHKKRGPRRGLSALRRFQAVQGRWRSCNKEGGREPLCVPRRKSPRQQGAFLLPGAYSWENQDQQQPSQQRSQLVLQSNWDRNCSTIKIIIRLMMQLHVLFPPVEAHSQVSAGAAVPPQAYPFG